MKEEFVAIDSKIQERLNRIAGIQSEEELAKEKEEKARKLAEKGFLPENDGYRETSSSAMEEVEKIQEDLLLKNVFRLAKSCGRKMCIPLW